MCLADKINIDERCSREVVEGSHAWGMSGEVCRRHWDYLKDFLARQKSGTGFPIGPRLTFEDTYLDDYTRLRVLMEDVAGFTKCLKDLSEEVDRGLENYRAGPHHLDDRFKFKGDPSFSSVRLSRILSYYEGLCWFPDSHANFADLLSPESFTWSLRNGLMPKDPGAGARHGDFTHRFQWHFVMRTITDGFRMPRRDGWNHTPLELFVSLGEPPASDVSIFFHLFDNNGPLNNSTLNNPDKVHQILKDSTFQPLKNYIGQRASKREGLQRAADEQLIRFYETSESTRQVRDAFGLAPHQYRPNAPGIARTVYAWRFSGGRPAKDFQAQWRESCRKYPFYGAYTETKKDPISNLGQAVTEVVASNLWDEITKTNGAPPKPAPAGKYKLATDAADTWSEMPGIFIKREAKYEDIASRVKSSRNGLNPHYRMTNLGAIPV